MIRFFCNLALFVKGGIHEVDILITQSVLCETQAFAESLEVYNLPGTEETDGVIYVGIIAEAENVVVGDACFLLCCDLVRTTFFFSHCFYCFFPSRGVYYNQTIQEESYGIHIFDCDPHS